MKDTSGVLVDVALTGRSVRNDVIDILEKHAANTVLVHTLRNSNSSEHIMFYYQSETSDAIAEIIKLSENPRRSCQCTQIPLIKKGGKFGLIGDVLTERGSQDVILRITPHVVELLDMIISGLG